MSELLGLVFAPAGPPLAAIVPALEAQFDWVQLQHVDLPTAAPWDQIAIGDREAHVFLFYDSPVEGIPDDLDFKDWPTALIPEQSETLVLDYRDVDLAKRVVCALARQHRFWIDTSFGEVYASEAFAARAVREPGWDWRAWYAIPEPKECRAAFCYGSPTAAVALTRP